MTTDHRDLAIETLAVDEATTRRQFAEVQAERDSYRTLLHAALEQLHEQSPTIDRLRATIEQDRESHRRLREQILLEERVAA